VFGSTVQHAISPSLIGLWRLASDLLRDFHFKDTVIQEIPRSTEGNEWEMDDREGEELRWHGDLALLHRLMRDLAAHCIR
jgi:hypothetical protein